MSAFSLHRRADIEAQRSVDAESSTVVPQQPDCKGSLGSQEIDGAESPVFGADCPEGSHLMVVDPRTEQVLAGPFDEVQAAIKRGREISPRAVFEVRVCSTHAR